MKITIHRPITCTDAFKCSDQIVNKLEKKFNQKYKSDPNNSVTISHQPNNHKIIIETNKTIQQIEDTL